MPNGRVERIGHRGAPREVMENTLPSFARALELGADAIELDVHVTSDGIVVVHHDETVRGHTIRASPWREVAAIELANGGHIPRLDDVFEMVGSRATIYIELKGAGVETPALVAARRWGGRYALHCFDHAAIERVAAAAPDVARGVLLDRDTRTPTQAMRAAIARTSARDVWPHWSLVDAPFMDEARALGVRVIVWTVNSDGTARALRELGVQGLCTDDLTILANL